MSDDRKILYTQNIYTRTGTVFITF
jgi:hypothetical protein